MSRFLLLGSLALFSSTGCIPDEARLFGGGEGITVTVEELADNPPLVMTSPGFPRAEANNPFPSCRSEEGGRSFMTTLDYFYVGDSSDVVDDWTVTACFEDLDHPTFHSAELEVLGHSDDWGPDTWMQLIVYGHDGTVWVVDGEDDARPITPEAFTVENTFANGESWPCDAPQGYCRWGTKLRVEGRFEADPLPTFDASED